MLEWKQVQLQYFLSVIGSPMTNLLWLSIMTSGAYYSQYKRRAFIKLAIDGRDPWSSGYGRRLTFQRSWVWIPGPYTGWTRHFFTLICCKNCIVCLKRLKIKEKEAGLAHLKNWPLIMWRKSLNAGQFKSLQILSTQHILSWKSLTITDQFRITNYLT